MQRLGILFSLLLASACADGDGGDSAFGSGNTVGAVSSSGAMTTTAESNGPSSAPTTTGEDPSTGGGAETTTFTTDPGSSGGPSVDCGAGLSACGVLCVDHLTDPANCGDCGITCVIPNAQSSCIASSCAVGDCDIGWFNCDGAVANGCETQTECPGGGGDPCTTECGSAGVTGADGVCQVPAETCNAVDDNCNGSCDEGAIAGCRQSVHRANGPNGHYYTNVLAETSQAGRSLESADYWWMYAEQADGLTALYRCNIGAEHTFLTTSNTCEGAGSIAATLGYLSPGASCGSTPLYRLRSPAGRHFYTINAGERDNAVNNLGFISEGSPGQIWTGA